VTPIFYDEKNLEQRLKGRPSIFLAGPTVRGAPRTPWRARALELLGDFDGLVVLPEFDSLPFDAGVRTRYCDGDCPIPGMRVESYNVLAWETEGIERVSAVLFWMPFTLGDERDPGSLPGFTTRAEVARELVRDKTRLALGMPPRVLSGGHIRFHAWHAGVRIHETLEDTVAQAVKLASLRGR